MTVTIKQIGKTYEVSDDNTVKVTHDHDAVVSVCGEYYKNKYTGEWLSELEAEQARGSEQAPGTQIKPRVTIVHEEKGHEHDPIDRAPCDQGP